MSFLCEVILWFSIVVLVITVLYSLFIYCALLIFNGGSMDILKRIFRSAVAVGVPVAIQWITASTNPTIMLLAPVLMGIGKWLRDKYQIPYVPV